MHSMRAHVGFTLIEILIVVLIISIVTSVGMLTISRNNNKEIEYFAKELTQVIQLAEEQAMLHSSVLGLIIKSESYQFVVLEKTPDNKKERWSPLLDNVLGKHTIPDHVQMTIDTHDPQKKEEEKSDDDNNDEEKPPEPQLVISPNGDVTPFVIYIGAKGTKPRFTITGAADGTITRKELE